MNQNQERLRTIISLFFSFLLSLMLLFLSLLLLVRFVWIGNGFLFSNLEQSRFSELVHQELKETIASRAIPFGVSEDVIDHVFTEDQVRREIERQLKARLDAREVSVDTQFLQEELQMRLEAFLKEQNIPVGQEHRESMEELVRIVESIYAQNVELPLMEAYLWGRQQVVRVFPWALGSLLVMGGLCLSLLFGLQRATEKRSLYLVYSILGSGLLLSVMPGLVLARGTLERIQIAPESLYSFVSVGGNRILTHMILAGVGLLLLGVVIAFAGKIRGSQQGK